MGQIPVVLCKACGTPEVAGLEQAESQDGGAPRMGPQIGEVDPGVRKVQRTDTEWTAVDMDT